MEKFRVPAVDRLILRMLALRRYDSADFLLDEGNLSVRLVEEAVKRWLTDLEFHLHAADEDRPSLQVLIMERVRTFVDSLPAWNGRWPDSSQTNDTEHVMSHHEWTRGSDATPDASEGDWS